MTDRVERSVKDFFCDDIFGKRVFDDPNLDSWHPAQSVFIGGVDFLIFPLIMTGVLFVLSCFLWFFAKPTHYFLDVWPGNCSVVLFPPYYLFGILTFYLAIAVAACLLLRAIASAVLFLIALPFFFAYDAYVHRPSSVSAARNNNPVLNDNNSRPVTTTPQHPPRAPSIYSPPAQQTNHGQNGEHDSRSSPPPSYQQTVEQTLHSPYSVRPY